MFLSYNKIECLRSIMLRSKFKRGFKSFSSQFNVILITINLINQTCLSDAGNTPSTDTLTKLWMMSQNRDTINDGQSRNLMNLYSDNVYNIDSGGFIPMISNQKNHQPHYISTSSHHVLKDVPSSTQRTTASHRNPEKVFNSHTVSSSKIESLLSTSDKHQPSFIQKRILPAFKNSVNIMDLLHTPISQQNYYSSNSENTNFRDTYNPKIIPLSSEVNSEKSTKISHASSEKTSFGELNRNNRFTDSKVRSYFFSDNAPSYESGRNETNFSSPKVSSPVLPTIDGNYAKRRMDRLAEDTSRSLLSTLDIVEEARGKIKKKYKKYMLPLLLAYKLKFFTLIPLMMGGLVLLAGSTGLAGFFFALFAAVMGLKSSSAH